MRRDVTANKNEEKRAFALRTKNSGTPKSVEKALSAQCTELGSHEQQGNLPVVGCLGRI